MWRECVSRLRCVLHVIVLLPLCVCVCLYAICFFSCVISFVPVYVCVFQDPIPLREEEIRRQPHMVELLKMLKRDAPLEDDVTGADAHTAEAATAAAKTRHMRQKVRVCAFLCVCVDVCVRVSAFLHL